MATAAAWPVHSTAVQWLRSTLLQCSGCSSSAALSPAAGPRGRAAPTELFVSCLGHGRQGQATNLTQRLVPSSYRFLTGTPARAAWPRPRLDRRQRKAIYQIAAPRRVGRSARPCRAVAAGKTSFAYSMAYSMLPYHTVLWYIAGVLYYPCSI